MCSWSTYLLESNRGCHLSWLAFECDTTCLQVYFYPQWRCDISDSFLIPGCFMFHTRPKRWGEVWNLRNIGTWADTGTVMWGSWWSVSWFVLIRCLLRWQFLSNSLVLVLKFLTSGAEITNNDSFKDDKAFLSTVPRSTYIAIIHMPSEQRWKHFDARFQISLNWTSRWAFEQRTFHPTLMSS